MENQVTLYRVYPGPDGARLESEEFIEREQGYMRLDGERARIMDFYMYLEKSKLAAFQIGRSPQEAISLAVKYQTEGLRAAKKAFDENKRVLLQILNLGEKVLTGVVENE